MFQYIATTLISGERDAVLVDPSMKTEQTAQVINWIEASGRTLKHIFITHSHGDHWLGTGELLERFPYVTVFAAPGTIDLMWYHASPEVRARVWDRQFPDQIPPASVVATTPPGNTFGLEGSELRIVEVGHTDTDNTTVLHMPSIDETRAYLEDAERLSQTSHSALEFYNAIMERYPARLNPTALWFWGAQVLFPPAGASQSG